MKLLLYFIHFILITFFIIPHKTYAQSLPSHGTIRALVIMFNFPDNNSEPYSAAQITDLVTGPQNSMRSYYQEVSFGKLDISVNVVGWYTISESSVDCGSTNQYNYLADNAAKAAGVNLDDYDARMYLFPYTPSCGYGGIGSGNQLVINGTIDLYTWVHEFGHTFGLHHAASLDCFGKQIGNYFQDCAINRYGDEYDVMGQPYPGIYHLNAAFKTKLQWITHPSVAHVTGNGIYTIYSLEQATNQLQSLVIDKHDTNDYYFIEYRQPTGYDSRLPEGITRGALIHIYTTNWFDNDTFIIDTSPETPPPTLFFNASLGDGDSFIDTVNNIKITQLSHSTNSVTVQVETPPPTFTLNDMLLTLTYYTELNDIRFSPVEGKINSLDFAFVSKYLQ